MCQTLKVIWSRKFFLARTSSRPSWVGRRSGNLNILTFWVEAQMPANISYILVIKHVPSPAFTTNLCLKNGNWKEFIEYHLWGPTFLQTTTFLLQVSLRLPVSVSHDSFRLPIFSCTLLLEFLENAITPSSLHIALTGCLCLCLMVRKTSFKEDKFWSKGPYSN